MKQLMLGMIPEFMAWPAVVFKLFAGCQGDLQIAFDGSQINSVLAQATGGASDMYLEMAKPSSLQNQFAGVVKNLPPEHKDDLRSVRDIMDNFANTTQVIF